MGEQAKSAQKWKDELKRYAEAYDDFTTRGKRIVKRYRDERTESENAKSRYNILWANVRTLKPAIYSRPPKPEVSRRFKDDNPIARVASTIIERALSYEITQFTDYHSALANSVEDRLLPGRGVAWVRYEPVTEEIEEPQITEDAEAEETAEGSALAGEEPLERIASETCPVDYVFWGDFAHLPARTWEEVTWVARRVYLSESEGVDRFGEDFRRVPRNHSPDHEGNDKQTTENLKKAEVWEIWSKSDKSVVWVADGYDSILDEKADPLELEGFFPCPKPIYATITTGSLVPVSDYVLYQDQAAELDEITGRIQTLTKALKVRGIYAAEEKDLARLLKEAKDGEMIPVKNWPAFMEKGGMQNAVQFLALTDIVATLAELYRAREAVKQTIYEITGISDILRGASMASETLGAQQIKAQYASIRLNDMKDDVARFARDLLRMKAEVMCSKYQPQTLVDMSGIMFTNDGQYAEQAIALLKNEPLRNFAIDIENDTLVQIDEQSEKQSRVEFLTAASSFIEKSVQAAQMAPELGPLMGEMLMFGVRGFKVGRDIEASMEATVEKLKQAQATKANQPPPPNPEQMKMQAEQQAKQADMQQAAQFKQMELQAEAEREAMRLQAEAQSQAEQRMLEKYKADLDASTRITIAGISAQQETGPALTASVGEVVNDLSPAIKARAEGGPVSDGQPYLVGENGPEVIVPQTSGVVIPNQEIRDPNMDPLDTRMHKGMGYLGPMQTKSGHTMTENSISGQINGVETSYPSVVPTLTQDEVQFLLGGGRVFDNESIMAKAKAHAEERLRQGRSPFASDDESPVTGGK